MSEPREVVAVIPARGGSKGLTRKNVRLLAGIPMIAYSIAAARGCPGIDRTVVTTEDHEIEEVALAYGAEVVRRPAKLAEDDVPTSAVTRHTLEMLARDGYEPDDVVLLQPTSPLRTAAHVTACLAAFHTSSAASVLTVTVAEHHPRKMFTLRDGLLEAIFAREDIERPRQQLEPAYRANGALFGLTRESFLEGGRFVVPPVLGYEMSADSSVDVDSALDLLLAETLLADRAGQRPEPGGGR